MADSDPGDEFVACSSERGEACSGTPCCSPAIAWSHRISCRKPSFALGATGRGSQPSTIRRRGFAG